MSNRIYLGAICKGSSCYERQNWVLTDDPIKLMEAERSELINTVDELKTELMIKEGLPFDSNLNWFNVWEYEKNDAEVTFLLRPNLIIPESMTYNYQDTDEHKEHCKRQQRDLAHDVARRNPGVTITGCRFTLMDGEDLITLNKPAQKYSDGAEFIYFNHGSQIVYDPKRAQAQTKAARTRQGSGSKRRAARLRRGDMTKTTLKNIARDTKWMIRTLQHKAPKINLGGANFKIENIPYSGTKEDLMLASTWSARLALLLLDPWEVDVWESLTNYEKDGTRSTEDWQYNLRQLRDFLKTLEVLDHLENPNPEENTVFTDFIDVFTRLRHQIGEEKKVKTPSGKDE